MNKNEISVLIIAIDRRMPVQAKTGIDPRPFAFPPGSIVSVGVEVHTFAIEEGYLEQPITVIKANDNSQYFTFEPYEALMGRLG